MKRLMAEWKVIAQVQRGKMGMLGLLVLVLGVMVGKRFFFETARSARAIDGGVEETLSDAEQSQELIDSIRALAESAGTIVIKSAGTVQRDLFVFDEAYFPRSVQADSETGSGAKSGAPLVETERDGLFHAEGVVEQVRKDAAGLSLKSTLLGTNPMAVIEVRSRRGREALVVRPGHMVEGFVLKDVRSYAVVLEKDGVRVELKRQLPE